MGSKRSSRKGRRQNRAMLRHRKLGLPAQASDETPLLATDETAGADPEPLDAAPEPASIEPTPARSTRGSRVLWAAAIVAFWVLVLAGAMLVGGAVWVLRTFGPVSVDQLLMNLPGGGGEGAGGTELLWGVVTTAILIPVAAILVLALLTERSRRALRRGGALRGKRTWAFRAVAVVLALAVPLSGAAIFGSAIGAGEYVEAQVREATGGTTLADYYVVPRHGVGAGGAAGQGMRVPGGSSSDAPAAEHRNVIIVYLESIEETLGEDLFEKDMLKSVERATEGWDTIPNLRQYTGGGWTMAGIVSTQCGIPLRSAGSLAAPRTLNKIGADGEAPEDYLAGATCLGDVLAREGYRNVFMGGANADFAGKGTFLRTHGYDEVRDLKEWEALGETEKRSDWGLSDRKLFEYAREEVTRLHEEEEPFNLTLLTLDTHEPPVVHDYCEQDTEVAMTSIVDCSMQQVAGFVDYLDETGILEDTTVVVMGDHLRMIAEGAAYWDELKDRDDRTIFNRVWVPGGAKSGVDFARTDIDQFSMYPTLIELAGIELADHRAGIGVSALVAADEVPEGTILDLDGDDYDSLVRSRAAAFYRELWRASPASSAESSGEADEPGNVEKTKDG
ncbi:MAG: LTA synthase family protein [Leucobacter sp.]